MTYSQFDEDRLTLPLIHEFKPPHMFLEIGCGNGLENNTRILQTLGWGGVWIDADPANCQTARDLHLPGVQVICERITLKNIAWVKSKMPTEFGVLSIDVDGNDYHFWRALCEGEYGLRPYIVIIEAQIQKPGWYIMPYDEHFMWDPSTPPELEQHNFGASVEAMIALGMQLGYRYYGKPENPHCPNLYFLRKDLYVDPAADR